MNTSTTTAQTTNTTNTKEIVMKNLNKTLDRIQGKSTWNLPQLRTYLLAVHKEMKFSEEEIAVVKEVLAYVSSTLERNNFEYLNGKEIAMKVKSLINGRTNPQPDFALEATGNLKQVSIYTDGSSSKNVGGAGVYLVDETSGKSKELSEHLPEATNNIAELHAMQLALDAIKTSSTSHKFTIFTDSEYVILSLMNKDKNIAKNFKKVANSEKLQELYSLIEEKGITLETKYHVKNDKEHFGSGDAVLVSDKVDIAWIKAHAGLDGNEKADSLANAARKRGPDPVVAETVESYPEASEEVLEAPMPEMYEDPTLSIPDELYAQAEAMMVDTYLEVDESTDNSVKTYTAKTTPVKGKKSKELGYSLDNKPMYIEPARVGVETNISVRMSQDELLPNALEYLEMEHYSELLKDLDIFEEICLTLTKEELEERPALNSVLKHGQWIDSIREERKEKGVDTQAKATPIVVVDKLEVEASEEKSLEQMCDEAKDFEDIVNILELSSEYSVGKTACEDFTAHTSIVNKEGKTMFEIIEPERKSSREGYIKQAANKLLDMITEENTDKEEALSEEYGFVVYESDAPTMSMGEDEFFEDVEVFVQVVEGGFIHEGKLFEDMDKVVQYSESNSQYKSCCSPEFRPATLEEVGKELNTDSVKNSESKITTNKQAISQSKTSLAIACLHLVGRIANSQDSFEIDLESLGLEGPVLDFVSKKLSKSEGKMVDPSQLVSLFKGSDVEDISQLPEEDLAKLFFKMVSRINHSAV